MTDLVVPARRRKSAGRGLALPPERIYRVARSGSVLSASEITAYDAELETAGNRFDVPGGGVLYAASDPRGCYAETLARFRVSARVRAAVERVEAGGSHMVCGAIPADWRARRVKASLRVQDPLPFLDVEAPATHELLTTELASQLSSLGVDVLDVSHVRGRDRRITRAIASWAYHAVDDEQPVYSGIRYVSRLGDWECWAVFDGSDVIELDHTVIQAADPDLQKIAETFRLRIF